MLSSVAERVYWLGRYMERVENSARLMDVYSNMLLDMPRGSNISWDILLDIAGMHELYAEKNTSINEVNVVRFLLADTHNPASVFSCLKMLRENARTTREVIPSEAWEQINELYLFTKDSIASGIGRKSRRELFQIMIADCQRLAGLLSGSMAHNTAYTFIQLGRLLERADMSTRIVDVGSISLLPAFSKLSKQLLEPYENVVWMNILRSLSGYQAYRQNVASRVGGEGVVRFLLQDNEFPRAVNFCLDAINENVEQLPNHDDVQLAVERVKRITSEANVFHLLENGLLEFIDELQISIADIHDALNMTWFRYSEVDLVTQSSVTEPGASAKPAKIAPVTKVIKKKTPAKKIPAKKVAVRKPVKKKAPIKKVAKKVTKAKTAKKKVAKKKIVRKKAVKKSR